MATRVSKACAGLFFASSNNMKRKQHWKKFRKSASKLGNMRVQLGAIGDHDDSNLTNAAILRMSETGVPSRNVPARFSITRGYRDNLSFISKFTQKTIKQNTDEKGFNTERIGNSIGVMLMGIIKASIMSGLEPGLSDKYRIRKAKEGFPELPYIKTRQMLNSISYGVKL